MARGVYVIEEHLVDARRAIKQFRTQLEGAEAWLDGDDLVAVSAVWERKMRDETVERLGQLEDTLAGLLALCEEQSVEIVPNCPHNVSRTDARVGNETCDVMCCVWGQCTEYLPF